MSVAVGPSEAGSRPGIELAADPPAGAGPLACEAHIGGGVHLGIDLLAPRRWHRLRVSTWDEVSEPVVRALAGEAATARLGDFVRSGSPALSGAAAGLVVDPRGSAPWLRVAVLEALDRRLHLPLDQSLLDAERGVAQGLAALTLARGGDPRTVLLGGALRLARLASDRLVRYLDELGVSVPPGLRLALTRLVRGYACLAAEVSGPDRALAAVLESGRRFTHRASEAEPERWFERTSSASGAATAVRPSPPRAPLGNMIDPRQVPARVLALATDPTSAEITLSPTTVSERAALLVRVPAYVGAHDQDVARRLLVRLVDRASSHPRGQALLTLSAGRPENRAPSSPFFEAAVALHGSAADDVRADVFDALSTVPPASADTDESLQEVRRATVFLGGWRRLVALAQLPVPEVEPGQAIRELAKGLEPADRKSWARTPLFSGGPSSADLYALADQDDAELLTRLRSPGQAPNEPVDGMFAGLREAGTLLVAELASVSTHLDR